MKLSNVFLILVLSLIFTACEKEDALPNNTPITEGNDPNFKIVPNEDGILSNFNRKVVVFGIDIYAVSSVSDARLLHAANVMAQYLDNDEDGTVDNPAVVDKMIEKKAFMVMWNSEDDLDEFPSGREGQDLGNHETIPEYVSNGLVGRFDASLEEVLHLITHVGYASVYPAVFGEQSGSAIAEAMDIARGGHFTSIPNSYPSSAWYTYDDNTCDYSCQVTEYTYWVLTSILGAQSNRLSEIQQEWKLNTSEKVQAQDQAAYDLFADPQYKFPTVLPNGKYRR